MTRYIVRLALFVLVLFMLAASAQSAHAQSDCSAPDSSGDQVSPPSSVCSTTSALNPATISFSQTQTTTFECRNTNNSSYLSVNSSVTGYGKAHCTPVSLYCKPLLEIDITKATSPTDYNRFYNRAYDSTYTSSGCVTNSSIGFRQDFWECLGTSCAQSANCGYCPNPNGACYPSPCGSSPIVVDLSGKGFVLTDANGGVKFDITGKGTAVQMGWTAAGSNNAFLTLPGVDGLVHNGT